METNIMGYIGTTGNYYNGLYRDYYKEYIGVVLGL